MGHVDSGLVKSNKVNWHLHWDLKTGQLDKCGSELCPIMCPKASHLTSLSLNSSIKLILSYSQESNERSYLKHETWNKEGTQKLTNLLYVLLTLLPL